MNGWMFFPTKEKLFSSGEAASLLLEMLQDTNRLSREEWNTYVPESRERLQGRSLGFFCGGAGLDALKHSPAAPDLPDFPMPVFVSDFSIMPLCWTFKNSLVIDPAPNRDYLIFLQPGLGKVITVTGTLPDRPPCYGVHGGYCFFPPPYIFPEKKTDWIVV